MRLFRPFALFTFSLLAPAQTFLYEIDAFAGRDPAPDGVDVSRAGFANVNCVERDETGNIYFCTNANGNIFRLSPDGQILRVFGSGVAGFASGGARDFGDGGRAIDAHGAPRDMAIDTEGNLYFVQVIPGQLRKISPDGIVTRLAGTQESGFSGDGGPAELAQLSAPLGVAIGPDGTIYISDAGNDRIRKITPDGTIRTVAGGGSQLPTVSGIPGPLSLLLSPRGLDLDADGNLYIAEVVEDQIYRLTPGGVIQTVAGAGGNMGLPLSDGVLATQAWLDGPQDVAIAPNGEIYIAVLLGMAVAKVTDRGTLEVVRGAEGELFGPASIKMEPDGSLLVADDFQDAVHRISPDGASMQLTSERFDPGPGPATDSLLYFPNGVLFDPEGNPLIVDSFQHVIRRVHPDGVMETIVGNGVSGRAEDSSPGPDIPLGRLRDAVYDESGNLYVTDYTFHEIRKIELSGRTTRFAGTGDAGFSGDGGPATSAQMAFPRGIAISLDGDIYFSDSENQRIRRIRDGFIQTIAGTGVQGFFGEGVTARAAAVNSPRGLAFDDEGNLYVADTFNHRIRKIDRDGVITTFAGNGEKGHPGDGGPATEASLNEPHRLSFDADGYLYIGDSYNHVIRMITPAGVIHTIAGSPIEAGDHGDGGAALDAKLNLPKGVAIRPNGDVIFSDNDNHRVRILQPRPRIADSGVVNAAGFQSTIAPGSIASIFGTNLAGAAASAGVSPLPAALAFSSVSITDSAGATHEAGMYFASKVQTNFFVPSEAAAGPATVTVRRDNGSEHETTVEIANVAPGVFGQAVFLIVRADGTRETGVVSGELDLGAEGDQVFLMLFGTGIRNAGEVTATVGGIETPVLFAGDQEEFDGLDQVNVGPLPRGLTGEVAVVLAADGIDANGFTMTVR